MKDKIISLNKNGQFQRLYKRESFVTPSLILYCKRNGLTHNRLGITVSKKVGNAPMRNRAKRRLKEVYRLNKNLIKTGYDIVMVARVRTVDVEYNKLTRSFFQAVKNAGLVNQK